MEAPFNPSLTTSTHSTFSPPAVTLTPVATAYPQPWTMGLTLGSTGRAIATSLA